MFKRTLQILNYNNKKNKGHKNLDLNIDNIESIEYIYNADGTDNNIPVTSIKIRMVSGRKYHHTFNPPVDENKAILKEDDNTFYVEG